MFTKKMNVQAIDPETKHWVRAKVLEEGVNETKNYLGMVIRRSMIAGYQTNSFGCR